MQRTHDRRSRALFAGAFLTLIASTAGACGQTLPAMPPTTLPGQTPGAPAAPAVVTPPPNPPHRAEVLFANGQLQVRADNSSLNQILRSIAHITGLKITGGVEEQRVFGNYGPGPLSTVLATLIDGTGANIFLLGGDAKTPPELILTSRSGGAEPPSPTSPAYAMYDENNDHSVPVSPPAPHSAIMPAPPQTPAITSPGSVPPAVNHPNAAPPAGTTTTAAPPPAAHPGTLTPEIVAQELLQMQAQQDQKKKQLDEKLRQQQIDQQKKLQQVKPQHPPSQNPPSQPPAGSTPQ